VIPYRKFSDLLKEGDLAAPNPSKAPKIEANDYMKRDALGGLGALGVMGDGEAPIVAANILAPLFKSDLLVKGEPNLEQPFPGSRPEARRFIPAFLC
jgi:hypothetical protein